MTAPHVEPATCGALNGAGAICREPKGHDYSHRFAIREVAMPGEELPEDREWFVCISMEEMGL